MGSHDHDHDQAAHDHAPKGPHDRGHTHDHGDHDHGAHDHDHREELRGTPASRLQIALALTVGFLGVEVAAGFATHSLALLSDAAHMLIDSGALALALMAQRVAVRPRTSARTYGFRRAETLAAFVNGVVLAASAVWIFIESVRRCFHPTEVQGRGMIIVAVLGLVVNLLAAWVLSRGDAGKNTNTRAALMHVTADAAGSVAAILAAACVLWLRWNRADPAVSAVLSLWILWGAWRLVVETVHVLMEGTPLGVDMNKLADVIRHAEGVADLHDLHAWTVAEGFPVVTVHVVLAAGHHGTEVAARVAACVERETGVSHVTVQPEVPHTAPALVPADRLRRSRA